ncbi:hypothetical protein C8A00DRAFT_17932 [Chaetomidium leptoderma]|uniref:Uncharacterized protein n=1 Tax=Chaetomidium leptoderma TaxID=669021 RepID=A0AAN6VFK9_9PEZI|nr:hypothetical protein C8A00DRAFT_17932 [Chaetomidium leptoderma]
MRVLRAGLGSTGQSPSLRREHGWIRTSRIQGWNRLCVDEARISVAVRTTCGLDLPIFTLITLFDISTGTRNWHASIPPSEYLGNLGCIDQWKNRSIRPSTRSTAISAFAYRIHSLCSLWAEEWDFTLNAIESELEVELLRFASVWIRESVDDLRTVVEVLKEKHFSLEEKKNNPQVSFLPDSPEAQRAALEVFRQNWEIVLSHHQKLADGLLGRIAKKQEEVNSLREGLFTATAVSEATKSKQLNHYILVFTVVTIFYLPLSFVALFSWDDPNQKTSFVITLVVVAGTTYGFAGYLIWFVQAPERRQAAKEKAQRVKSMGNLFK